MGTTYRPSLTNRAPFTAVAPAKNVTVAPRPTAVTPAWILLLFTVVILGRRLPAAPRRSATPSPYFRRGRRAVSDA
ncbi:hypothetical protein [Streptomyces acidiscabies]|uniref:hypothetical protein n=1 Tax=Streptomyces acidiscabies TaxID=42234 RepID=UPI000A94BFFF|nr:hypothetical protein [Streptomyces acidiscabies]